jgi:MFS family permease
MAPLAKRLLRKQDDMPDPHPAQLPTPAAVPWFATITREQWHALLAAMLGWMFDAMDFVLYLMALTTLQEAFGFGADTAGLLATVSLLASAASGLLFGVVADKIGRTRALMATILIFSVCSVGTATAQDLVQLLIWRTLLGIGMGGEWASGAVLVSETWPPQHRDKAIGIMQSGWALGYILAAVVAGVILPTLGWRWLFVVGAAPALLVFCIRSGVQEPAVWTASQPAPAGCANPFEAILGPALLGRTVMGTLLTTAVMFAYWGLFTWLPAILASPPAKGGAGMSIVQSLGWIIPKQAGAFLGYLSFGFLADRLGRRPAFILFLVTAAVLVPIHGHMGRQEWVLMALGPVLGFVGHGSFSLLGALLAELFPTAARATGQGFTYNCGRALSALAPLSIGLLAQVYGIGPALGLTSALFVAGAVLILFIPDTSGKELDGELAEVAPAVQRGQA